jgi:hypothetical protein
VLKSKGTGRSTTEINPSLSCFAIRCADNSEKKTTCKLIHIGISTLVVMISFIMDAVKVLPLHLELHYCALHVFIFQPSLIHFISKIKTRRVGANMTTPPGPASKPAILEAYSMITY